MFSENKMIKTIFAIALIMFFFSPSVSFSSPEPGDEVNIIKNINNTHPTNNDKKGTENVPLVIKGNVTVKDSESTEAEKKHETVKTITEVTNIVLSFFLVLITGFLAFYTRRLWRSTYDLVKGAEETAKKQLRAYVFVKEIKVDQVPSADRSLVDNWRITFILGNGGNTPTKNLLHNINWAVFDKPLADDFDFPDKPYGKPSVGMIGPNADLYSEYVDIPTDLVNYQVANSQQHVYIWGWVNYDDVIDKTTRHRTEYCTEVKKHGTFMGFMPHAKFNGFDDECFRSPKPYKNE